MKPKKSLGQNFLENEKILNKIVKYGEISYDDIVIEIGPGKGNLTEKILEKKPHKLIVIEKDEDLSKILKKKYGNKLTIVNKDILECYNDFKYEAPIKIFGNLPYNISTKILISYLKLENLNKLVKKFIFIFQKEVAERIVAEKNSKNYGRLSILCKWKMESFKAFDIDPKYFFPVPKVWSSLIVLQPKLKYQNSINSKNLEHITNVFFNQRRKMIRKPMKILFSKPEEVAEKLNIDLNFRPQNLSEKEYFEICKYYENLV